MTARRLGWVCDRGTAPVCGGRLDRNALLDRDSTARGFLSDELCAPQSGLRVECGNARSTGRRRFSFGSESSALWPGSVARGRARTVQSGAQGGLPSVDRNGDGLRSIGRDRVCRRGSFRGVRPCCARCLRFTAAGRKRRIRCPFRPGGALWRRLLRLRRGPRRLGVGLHRLARLRLVSVLRRCCGPIAVGCRPRAGPGQVLDGLQECCRIGRSGRLGCRCDANGRLDGKKTTGKG